MKTLFALLLLAASATPAYAGGLTACGQWIKSAQAALLTAQDSFNVGEVTMLEVTQAEVALLNQRFECRDMLYTEYCTAVQPKLKNVLDFTLELKAAGQATERDVLNALNSLMAVNERCN